VAAEFDQGATTQSGEGDLAFDAPAFRLTPPGSGAPNPGRKPAAEKPGLSVPGKQHGGKLNVLKLARQRLADLKREIKRLRRLETERDQLERLLRAADGKPVAVVAPIRTAR
jgi:hypothetical protein